MMNEYKVHGPPDWQDGDCCFRCRTQFTLVARKHHCRNCGNIFCARCSSQQIPIPKLNHDKSVRVCDGCYEKLSSKKEDPLDLAINKSSDSNGTQAKVKQSSSKSSGSSKSASSNKMAANASAPSEQDLKEEEELQLALALSLSEAPTKVNFPDCRQLEDSSSSVTPVNNYVDSRSTNSASISKQSTNITTSTNEQSLYTAPVKQQEPISSNSIQPLYMPESSSLDRDQDLFKFIFEVQSTAEVFTNRVNSSKLRNRPIANDSAIQSLFLKLTNMHTKLLEYIKTHDNERSGYEALQDKLSQIADARAALDALREEHQEKIRQEAAEAERQRQSQLALKLEMMRQKKSQMMQYQREVALQRIQAQEMMLHQPQGYPSTPATVPQQQAIPSQHTTLQQPTALQQQTAEIQQQQITLQQMPMMQQIPSVQQLPGVTPMVQQSPMTQQSLFQPPVSQSAQQLNQMSHQNDQTVHQSVPTKADDEALLISFDD